MSSESQIERSFALVQLAASEAQYLIEREWDFNNLEPIWRPLPAIDETNESSFTEVIKEVDLRPSHEKLNANFEKYFPKDLQQPMPTSTSYGIFQFALDFAERLLKDADGEDIGALPAPACQDQQDECIPR